jgi:hypothetical protein
MDDKLKKVRSGSKASGDWLTDSRTYICTKGYQTYQQMLYLLIIKCAHTYGIYCSTYVENVVQ